MIYTIKSFLLLKQGLKSYIEAEDPDILCLEETKVSKETDGAVDYKKYQYYWWGINEIKKGHGTVNSFALIINFTTFFSVLI